MLQHVQNKREQVARERTTLAAALGICLMILALFNVFDNKLDYIQEQKVQKLTEEEIQRTLSINLGDGACELTTPLDVDQDIDLFSTLIVASPGSGHRTAFMQLEGLTALTTGDDYRLTPDSLGKKFAFMKTSYPHFDGTWSWTNEMSQSILLIRNPRTALVNLHNILYEIDFSTTWEASNEKRLMPYTHAPPVDDWIGWRETRFDAEIKRWGWFIDFWMEGGLKRDIFTNELTTSEHFERLMLPAMYALPELLAGQAELENVEPEIDFHCKFDMTCQPAFVSSFEKLTSVETGPEEMNRFANAVQGKDGINEMLDEEARICLWRELILNGGHRQNYPHRASVGGMPSYDFTPEQMQTMNDEINRVKTKYSQGDWVNNTNAQKLVEYMEIYLADNTEELDKYLEE